MPRVLGIHWNQAVTTTIQWPLHVTDMFLVPNRDTAMDSPNLLMGGHPMSDSLRRRTSYIGWGSNRSEMGWGDKKVTGGEGGLFTERECAGV